MLEKTSLRWFRWLGLAAAAWACVSSAGSGAPPAEQAAPAVAPAPGGSPPVEAELRASPPAAPPASPAPGEASGTAAPADQGAAATPAVSSEPLSCVRPPDPELDKESPWSRELGQRLGRELPKLQHCTSTLPAGEEATLTLRLVYQKDGSPVSQHVVASTKAACPVSDCLARGLGAVPSPALFIDKGSVDVTLALSRDRAPERISEPVDPLTPEEPGEGQGSCVDPAVAQLSHGKVREVVSTIYDELQLCYTQALVRNHSASGRVGFEFVIGQNGTVTDAWAREATFPDCIAVQCMLDQFRTLRFPEPVGRSVRIIYPISYVLEQAPVKLQ